MIQAIEDGNNFCPTGAEVKFSRDIVAELNNISNVEIRCTTGTQVKSRDIVAELNHNSSKEVIEEYLDSL